MRRLGSSARRFDPAAFRELMDDGKIHLCRALVVLEGAQHYEIVDGGADVLIDVQLLPSGTPCTARLGGLGGGPGLGFWAIPPVGAEVVVGVPEGDLEAGVVILACESTGQVPDGLGPTTYVICVPAGGQLLVHDGAAGDAKPLPTLAEFNAHRAWVVSQFATAAGHTHTVSGSATTAIQSVPSSPTAAPAPGTPPGEATGTEALKTK